MVLTFPMDLQTLALGGANMPHSLRNQCQAHDHARSQQGSRERQDKTWAWEGEKLAARGAGTGIGSGRWDASGRPLRAGPSMHLHAPLDCVIDWLVWLVHVASGVADACCWAIPPPTPTTVNKAPCLHRAEEIHAAMVC